MLSLLASFYVSFSFYCFLFLFISLPIFFSFYLFISPHLFLSRRLFFFASRSLSLCRLLSLPPSLSIIILYLSPPPRFLLVYLSLHIPLFLVCFLSLSLFIGKQLSVCPSFAPCLVSYAGLIFTIKNKCAVRKQLVKKRRPIVLRARLATWRAFCRMEIYSARAASALRIQTQYRR